MHNFHAAIFDMDGTILDSTAMWSSAAAHVVRTLGATPKDSITRDTLPLGMLEYAPFLREDYQLSQPVEEIHAVLQERITRYYTQEATLKPGALAFLQLLHARGVSLRLATATDWELVEPALRRCQALDLFDAIYTCGQVGHSKHTPEIYRAALDSTPREQAWVFEDALYAMETAVGDGFQVCAVADTANPHQWDTICALAHCHMTDFFHWQHLPFAPALA